MVPCSLDLIKEAKLGAEKEEFLNLMVKVDFCPKTWRSGQQEGIYTRNWGWTSVLRGSCSGSRRLNAPESFSGGKSEIDKKHFYLDVVLSGDLDSRGEGVPLLPKQVPSAQGVPVVGQLHIVGSGDVDHDDVAAG